MRRLYINLSIRIFYQLLSWSLLCGLLLGLSTQLIAQQASLPANKDSSTPFISTTALPTVSLAVATTSVNGIGLVYWETGGISGPNIDDHVINSSTTDFARVHFLSAGGSARLRVTDNTAANTYSGGNFAGFVIANSSPLGASLLGTITIATYNNGSFVEASTSNSLIGISSSLLSGAYEVGFITTLPFDAIEIRFGGLVSADTYDVYYAVQRRFATGPSLVCNTSTPLVTSANSSTATGFPAAVEPAHTGASGPTTFTVLNATNVTSSTLTDYASISAPLPVNVGGVSSVSLAVKNQVNPTGYSAGTFAGFDIENTEVIGASLLSSTTIKTYLNGVLSETVTGGSSLVSVPLLTATGRQTIGFVTSQPFNEVQIVFSFPATVSVGETRIYSVVLKSFCPGPTIACSTSAVTPLTNTSFPVYINNNHTGTGSSLACVGCAVNNADNVINGSTSSPATISLGTAVSATARLSVANPLDTYPAESFIGFDIESNTLVGANLLGRTRITLYNNGSAVQTGSGASLLAGVSLVSGGRQTVGTVAQVPFDEVEIEFTQLVSANPLGTVSIYRAVIQKACVTPVACNQTKFLNTTDFSAFIEGTRTGLFGLVSANLLGSGVANPGNAISPNTTDFARITNVLGVGVTASISVADPADVYPAGTFAGYTISKANLPVSATLFSSLTVTTYLNGVLQESSATAGNLIDLSVFLQIFGGVPSSDLSNVGFITSKPFDEIQLSVGSFASVLNYVDVYGAFIDTRTSSNGGSLVCNFVLNPDFNVTTKNVPVSGNVSTNDKVPTGTTYGTPVASGSNPAGATVTLTTTGAYSFTATSPGTYTYTVPVCATGQTSCPTTPLFITVLDSTIPNNPVANPDYASVLSSTATAGSVTINVRANDGPGNLGGTLGTPTIITAPTHGTAVITGGNVVYTPATGYIGDDVLTYQVCETPGGLCATATVTVHVVAPGGSIVTVVDDYVKTPANTVASGNVLSNDFGTGLAVSNAGTITSPGKGTLVLASNGAYTFTPVTGVTGPVDFTYTACDNSATAVCGTATLHVLVLPIQTVLNPDFAVTTINVPVSGNVNTNDVVLAGTTYGTPVPAGGNPSGGTILLNPNGTFSFTATSAGSFTYTVPVCPAGQTVSCPTSPLIITVLNPAVNTNKPVANPDYASVQGSPTAPSSVTVNVSANDGPGNPGGVLGTPTIVTSPAHGSASVTAGGNVVYTPTAGYYGPDVLTYQVCETPGGLCSTATVTLTVKAPGSTTVAIVDDYVKTAINTPVSSNVLTNDQGTGLTVSNASTITSPGKGTLVLASNGAYTFTPTTGVTGPVDFTYTACDGGSTCGTATLHIVVVPVCDLTPIVYARPGTAYGTTPITVVIDVVELQGVISTGLITVRITKDALTSLTFTPGATSVGGHNVQNAVWTEGDDINTPYYIFTTTASVPAGDVLSLGLEGQITPGASTGTLTVSTAINGGGEQKLTNNVDADKIDYFQQ